MARRRPEGCEAALEIGRRTSEMLVAVAAALAVAACLALGGGVAWADDAQTASANVVTYLKDAETLSVSGEGGESGAAGEDDVVVALAINADGLGEGSITYCVLYEDDGWSDWAENGELVGALGGTAAMKAIKVQLTGEAAEAYDVWYRVWVNGYGWTGWAKNGNPAGSYSEGAFIEAVQVVVLAKDAEGPGSTTPAVITSAALVVGPGEADDLTGSWVQTGVEDADTYLVGVVEDETITVYWRSLDEDGEETFTLYWSGTYEAAEKGGAYSWESLDTETLAAAAEDEDTNASESEGKGEATEDGADAEGEAEDEIPSLTFTYEDGVLSFEATALSVTGTVTMEQTEIDLPAAIAAAEERIAAAEAAAAEEAAQAEAEAEAAALAEAEAATAAEAEAAAQAEAEAAAEAEAEATDAQIQALVEALTEALAQAEAATEAANQAQAEAEAAAAEAAAALAEAEAAAAEEEAGAEEQTSSESSQSEDETADADDAASADDNASSDNATADDTATDDAASDDATTEESSDEESADEAATDDAEDATEESSEEEPTESDTADDADDAVEESTESDAADDATALAEPIVVVATDDLTITLTSLNAEGEEGYEIGVVIVNASADTTYVVEAADGCAADGVLCDAVLSATIAPGDTLETVIVIADSEELAEAGVAFTDLLIALIAYDAESGSAEEPAIEASAHVYPDGEENAVAFLREALASDYVLIDDDEMTVTIVGYTVELYIVNKTDGAVTLATDEETVEDAVLNAAWSATVPAGLSSFETLTRYLASIEEEAEESEESADGSAEDASPEISLELAADDADSDVGETVAIEFTLKTSL